VENYTCGCRKGIGKKITGKKNDKVEEKITAKKGKKTDLRKPNYGWGPEGGGKWGNLCETGVARFPKKYAFESKGKPRELEKGEEFSTLTTKTTKRRPKSKIKGGGGNVIGV